MNENVAGFKGKEERWNKPLASKPQQGWIRTFLKLILKNKKDLSKVLKTISGWI